MVGLEEVIVQIHNATAVEIGGGQLDIARRAAPLPAAVVTKIEARLKLLVPAGSPLTMPPP